MRIHACVVSRFSLVPLSDHMHSSPPVSSVYGDSAGKNTGVGCHSLLWGHLRIIVKKCIIIKEQVYQSWEFKIGKIKRKHRLVIILAMYREKYRYRYHKGKWLTKNVEYKFLIQEKKNLKIKKKIYSRSHYTTCEKRKYLTALVKPRSRIRIRTGKGKIVLNVPTQ